MYIYIWHVGREVPGVMAVVSEWVQCLVYSVFA